MPSQMSFEGLENSNINDDYDLIVAGFGPAALAIAIALHDILEANPAIKSPKIVFLERQQQFAWHSGMLLEGAKMQISFIKDLATLRNPRSSFTFLNYLHKKDRLVQFTNLSTFLPSRLEFNDYLKWCSAPFEKQVMYGEEVTEIIPHAESSGDSKEIHHFMVQSCNAETKRLTVRRARHVVIAIGGKPHIPRAFSSSHDRIIHSSMFANLVEHLLPDSSKSYRIAVIGGGQSAAEVFDNLQNRYSHCTTHLVFRGNALQPSDDSPFVNEIFDPARISTFYDTPSELRKSINIKSRNTNYGVVRLELLERLYETIYIQRVQYGNDETAWPHRMFSHANIFSVIHEQNKVRLSFNWGELASRGSTGTPLETNSAALDDKAQELPDLVTHGRKLDEFEYDLIILATGYDRNGYVDLLRSISQSQNTWTVGKDYKLIIPDHQVSHGAGIWLQGCNEETHGVRSLSSLLHCYSFF
jgi:L-ornithine N5-monooxygenase